MGLCPGKPTELKGLRAGAALLVRAWSVNGLWEPVGFLGAAGAFVIWRMFP